MKKRFLILPILTGVTAFTPLAACAKESIPSFDFDVIKQNYYSDMINTAPASKYDDWTSEQIKTELTPVTIVGALDKEYETYRFTNINYFDGDHATWPAHLHIQYSLQIAISAIKYEDDEIEKEEKLDIATKLTYFWIANNFKNWNWWFNTIGVPRDLSDLALIIFDRLSPRGQERLMEIIHRGSLLFNPETRTYTGANLIWYSDITLKSAVLLRNNKEMNMMTKYLLKEIKLDAPEGFQHDGTFFQHGREIYNGGYGRQGSTFICKILSAFAETKFKWPAEKLDILVNYILQGIKYTTHKGQFDYLVMGRALSRKSAAMVDGTGTDLGNVYLYRLLSKIVSGEKMDQIMEFLVKLENNQSSFEGIKCFPVSSYITMNVGSGVYIAFKGVTNTLVNSETANSENILGHNFSFGANTSVMNTGGEYQDISPVWNYARLPGTTCIDEDDEALAKYNDHDFKAPICDGPFFCGETDGVAFCMQKAYHGYRNGTEAEDELPKDKLHYTITCFATNKGMAILGSNIHFEGATAKTFTTTVEQCIKTGEVKNYGDQLVSHGPVIYKNINSNVTSKFIVLEQPRTGSWKRNKLSYDEDDRKTTDILQITYSSNDPSKYAYSIQPDATKDFNFKVACNDDKIHAIDIGDKIAVACYEPWHFTYESQTYQIDKIGYSVIDKK